MPRKKFARATPSGARSWVWYDNTKEWHVFFWCQNELPRRGWPVALSWCRELGDKWRFGWGIRIRGFSPTPWRPVTAHTFGVWWKTEPMWQTLGVWSLPEQEAPAAMKIVSKDRSIYLHKPGEAVPLFWLRRLRLRYYGLRRKRYDAKKIRAIRRKVKERNDWLEHLERYTVDQDG